MRTPYASDAGTSARRQGRLALAEDFNDDPGMLCRTLASPLHVTLFIGTIVAGCSADVDDLFEGGSGPGGSDTGGAPSTGGAETGGNPSVGGSPSSGGAPSTGGGPSNGGNGGNGGGGPTCGDGQAEGSEDCDGQDLAGATCEDFGFTDPAGLACTGGCAFDASGCAASCDGEGVEQGELCDGSDLGGVSCEDFGFANPDGVVCIGCAELDTTGCAAECGNGQAEPGEACDGNDNPASCVDLGFSNPSAGGPGCSNACQPTIAGCVATCGDGNLEPTEDCDDDNTMSGDGCSSTCTSEVSACQAATAVMVGPGTTNLTGTTASSPADLLTDHPDCGISASGRNKVYAVTTTTSGFFTAWLDRPATTFDSVLYVRTSCNDDATELACADSSFIVGQAFAGGGELVSFRVTSGQTLFVVIDGAFAGDEGNYSLNIDISSGQSCQDPIPFNMFPGTSMKATGTTVNQTASTGGSCGGTTADDVVYELVRRGDSITNMDTRLLSSGTNYDSLLHVRTGCNQFSSEVVCVDVGGNGGEQTDLLFQNNNTRYVWIDGSSGAEGNYTLEIDPN